MIVNHQFLLFTEDLKLFIKIHYINDYVLLQNDLNTLVGWADNLGLDFNIDTFHNMSFYRIRSHLEFSYSLRGTCLVNGGSTVNDLEVIYDRNLSFHAHIDATYCKALKALGFLKQVCNEFKLRIPLKTLYCTLYLGRF